jgi:hypothetical protein
VSTSTGREQLPTRREQLLREENNFYSKAATIELRVHFYWKRTAPY